LQYRCIVRTLLERRLPETQNQFSGWYLRVSAIVLPKGTRRHKDPPGELIMHVDHHPWPELKNVRNVPSRFFRREIIVDPSRQIIEVAQRNDVPLLASEPPRIHREIRIGDQDATSYRLRHYRSCKIANIPNRGA
jgi:hypothetical protein